MSNLHPEQFQDLNEFVRDIKIYHGTPATHLQPGDVIKPPRPRTANGTPHDGRVFGTNNPHWARMYAGKDENEGAIYEVEPIGALHRYTDTDVDKSFKQLDIPFTAEYAADAWRVLGRYE